MTAPGFGRPRAPECADPRPVAVRHRPGGDRGFTRLVAEFVTAVEHKLPTEVARATSTASAAAIARRTAVQSKLTSTCTDRGVNQACRPFFPSEAPLRLKNRSPRL